MIILAVAISNKKAQQETINKILSRINNYKQIIINNLNEIN